MEVAAVGRGGVLVLDVGGSGLRVRSHSRRRACMINRTDVMEIYFENFAKDK